mmetsp:Transcript_15896/g.40560  ORF Transcript_15896/g.40560 Transcript_15896/m.40560 type:complete len:217 (-) Transcript_15896:766-1416(-)
MRMSRTSPRRRSGCAPAAGGRGSDRQATRSPQTCSSATRPPPRAASMVARAPSSPPSERTRGASTRPSRRSQTPSSRRRRPKLNRRALLGGIRSFSSPCGTSQAPSPILPANRRLPRCPARCRSLSPRCSTSPRRSAARSCTGCCSSSRTSRCPPTTRSRRRRAQRSSGCAWSTRSASRSPTPPSAPSTPASSIQSRRPSQSPQWHLPPSSSPTRR